MPKPIEDRLTVARRMNLKLARAEKIMNRLEAHAEGNLELTNSQIRAYEVMLERLMPKLQAIEMIVETEEQRSEKELPAELQGLLVSNPELKSVLDTLNPELVIEQKVEDESN